MVLKYTLLLSLIALLSACSTTRVADVQYEKGSLLKQEESDPILERVENEMLISSTAVTLSERQVFKSKEIKIYEKIQRTEFETEGKTLTDSPFWAILGTPGALILDVFSLGMVGFTADMWVKDTREWDSIREKLADDFFIEEKVKYSETKQTMVGVPVSLFVNDNFVKSLRTNERGLANYDFAELLYISPIQPQALIYEQGVTIKAKYENTVRTEKFSNRSIPEKYFARKFEDMKDLLSQRKARFDNCNFIANNRREFFECFYQK